jgi:hypothetical protein
MEDVYVPVVVMEIVWVPGGIPNGMLSMLTFAMHATPFFVTLPVDMSNTRTLPLTRESVTLMNAPVESSDTCKEAALPVIVTVIAGKNTTCEP